MMMIIIIIKINLNVIVCYLIHYKLDLPKWHNKTPTRNCIIL